MKMLFLAGIFTLLSTIKAAPAGIHHQPLITTAVHSTPVVSGYQATVYKPLPLGAVPALTAVAHRPVATAFLQGKHQSNVLVQTHPHPVAQVVQHPTIVQQPTVVQHPTIVQQPVVAPVQTVPVNPVAVAPQPPQQPVSVGNPAPPQPVEAPIASEEPAPIPAGPPAIEEVASDPNDTVEIANPEIRSAGSEPESPAPPQQTHTYAYQAPVSAYPVYSVG